MTLEQLRIFVAVAERQHVTRAADDLRLSQSAVSSAIAALEAAHDVLLFNRVGRGIVLSDAGREFLPEARAVLNRAASAAVALDDIVGLHRGSITFGASQTISTYWVPQRLARFAQRYPRVRLTMIAGNTAQIVDAVLSGSVDFGFVEGAFESSDLTETVVATDQIGIYAAPSHPLARGEVGIDDLKNISWVLRELGSGTRAHFELGLAAEGIVASSLKVQMVLPSNEAALAVVMNGQLVTAVSELAAVPFLAMGRLKRLAVELPERSFRLIARKDRLLSRAGAAFIDLLSDSSRRLYLDYLEYDL